MNMLEIADCLGLELEFEGVGLHTSWEYIERAGIDRYWQVHEDGSLRPRGQTTEFVFAKPLVGRLALDAITQLSTIIAKKEYGISWRCGMHIHVDHRKSIGLVIPQVILACLLDRVWYGWDGTGRHESKFCVPISQVWKGMITSPEQEVPAPQIRRNEPELGEFLVARRQDRRNRAALLPIIGHKYTGLNIQRIQRGDINTVEYRYAASTKSVARIVEFITMAVWCKNFVRQIGSAEGVLMSFLHSHTYPQWINKYVQDEAIAGSFSAGVRNMQGPQYPTPLEIEAALALIHESKKEIKQ